MIKSLTKSSAAVLLVGVALFISSAAARAQMSAEDKYQQAWNQCMDAPKGQQSFCWENAHHQYLVDSAREQQKDVVIHYDNDASNDTPAQTKAKQNYQDAVNACMDGPTGQRSFCMEEAHATYKKGMGW